MNRKSITATTIITAVSACLLSAGPSLKDDIKKNSTNEPKKTPEETLKKHSKDSKIVAEDQDELSADVQDLIQDQTNKKVINLLADAEKLMAEATELLEAKKTDGITIAIETEIIEKIFAAAKEKSKGSGSKSSDSMLNRMRKMTGKKPGNKPGKTGEGNSPGQGGEGSSDLDNDNKVDSADNTKEERTVPKTTSAPSKTIPREEQRALDAYKKATSKN